MLVLRRSTAETIVFEHAGISFEMTVMSARGGEVSLAFNAPLDVVIRRKEISRRINDEQAAKMVADGTWPEERPAISQDQSRKKGGE